MSLEDMFSSIAGLAKDIGGEEKKLQEREETEKEYITHLINARESLNDEDIGEAVSVFMEETKLAKDIAENIIQLDEEDVKLRQFLEEQNGKVAENISNFEDSTEDLETLTNYFLDEMSKLQDEGAILKQIVQSRGSPENKEKFWKAEKNVAPAIKLAKNIKSENSISRRKLLKAGAAAGITSGSAGYLIGESQSDEKAYPRGVKASAEIFEEYLERKEQLTHKKNIDTSLPIALGERHKPPGNTFPTLLRLMKKHKPNKLGLEFLTRGNSVIREFNNGEISASEMTEHYFSKPSWDRIEEQVLRVFKYAKKENVKIVGLEYTSGREHYTNTLERFKKMADIVEEVNDGHSIFLAGANHVDRRMHVEGELLKNAHPEIAKNITVEDGENDPYLYRKFNDDIGIPDEISFSSPEESSKIYSYPEKYIFKGRVNALDTIASTHSAEQNLELQKSLRWLEETAVDEYEIIEDKINRIRSEIEKMEKMSSGGYYTTVSASGYSVFLESNPPSKYL